MPLIMQGNWKVSIKGKQAAFPQRFIISGASSGNGTYNDTSPDVNVVGSVWALKVQSNPGSGWKDSEYQITFPVIAGGQYRFDVETNDVWIGDKDFNDFVLTLSTAVTQTDFLVYGNVSLYSGCWYNPCYSYGLLIETPLALAQAARYPKVKDVLSKVYPRQLKEIIRKPIPLPDPPPFSPLILPVEGRMPIPAKSVQIIRQKAVETPTRKAKAAAAEVETQDFGLVRTVSAGIQARAAASIDSIYLDHLGRQNYLFCYTEPLVNAALRFLEYDRTLSELGGGTFTGTGDRAVLGNVATDRNGNYIFRFTLSIANLINEIDMDVAVGENEIVQAMPDLIVQALDSNASGGVAYETPPHWNIPLLKRLNICIPSSEWNNPTGCYGKTITHLGFIPVGKSTVTLDNDGRVTCTDTSKPDIPQTRCAAWYATLRLSACIGTYNVVPWYTIEHRAKTPTGWTDWKVYDYPVYMDKWNSIANDYVATKIGPTLTNVDLVAGGAKENVNAYKNIQGDMDWAGADWFVKAFIDTNSGVYRDGPGTVQFRIKAYNTSANQIGAVTETITLYFDNTGPELSIDEVSMGLQNGGDCALFHLSGEPNPAPLAVHFKALQRQGFLNSYTVAVRKGNLGGVAIQTTAPGDHVLSETYAHSGGDPCSQFFGTLLPVDPLADVEGFVDTQIIPAAGNWLAPAEPFCTFAVQLSAVVRRTNGHNDGHTYHGPVEYFLGIEQ